MDPCFNNSFHETPFEKFEANILPIVFYVTSAIVAIVAILVLYFLTQCFFRKHTLSISFVKESKQDGSGRTNIKIMLNMDQPENLLEVYFRLLLQPCLESEFDFLTNAAFAC